MFSVIILSCVLIISAINSRFCDHKPVHSLVITVALTLFVITIDGLFALLIRKLPSKYFDVDKKGFDASIKERKFYDFLDIKFWKDYVPELGGFTNFHKDKIRDPNSPEYLKRFIVECNYGSFIHIFTAFSGFLIIFFVPLNLWWQFPLPVAVVNMILNLMPAFILRYNVPRLKTLYKVALRKRRKN
jgi:hypothetical protein